MPSRWRANSACPRVLIPARPGITNALGCVVADLRHDFVRTLNRPLDTVDMADVHAVLAAQEAEGRRLIGPEKIALDRHPRRIFRRHAVRRPDPSAAGAPALGHP